MKRCLGHQPLGLEVRFIHEISEVVALVLGSCVEYSLRRYNRFCPGWDLRNHILGWLFRCWALSGRPGSAPMMVVMMMMMVRWEGLVRRRRNGRATFDVPERRAALGAILLASVVVVVMVVMTSMVSFANAYFRLGDELVMVVRVALGALRLVSRRQPPRTFIITAIFFLQLPSPALGGLSSDFRPGLPSFSVLTLCQRGTREWRGS